MNLKRRSIVYNTYCKHHCQKFQNMFSITNLIKINLIFICVFHSVEGKGDCLQTKLSTVNQRIDKLTENQRQPKYTITKIQYVSNKQAGSNDSCFQQRRQLLPSSSIYEGQNLAYSVIIKYCNEYTSIQGLTIASFTNVNNTHFVSSVKNDFTYFAEIQDGNISDKGSNVTVAISKLQVKNKKTVLQTSATLFIPKKFGNITAFSCSFSISQKLFAFATQLGFLLFYKSDGRLQNYYNLFLMSHFTEDLDIQNIQLNLQIVKLNNHLAIYTSKLNEHSFIFTINLNSKNNTITKFAISTLSPTNNSELILKYNDNNWSEFYVKIGTIIYVYQQKSSLYANLVNKSKASAQQPVRSYSLLTEFDEFHFAGNMLIVQSAINSIKRPNEPYRYYFNLTDGSQSQFLMPSSFCPHFRPYIDTSSETSNSYFLCMFCQWTYECYQLHADQSSNNSNYFDSSKFRMPLVLISIGIIIFVTFIRNKKSGEKTQVDEKEQQAFMKELQRNDKKLYQQITKNRTMKKPFNKPGRPQNEAIGKMRPKIY